MSCVRAPVGVPALVDRRLTEEDDAQRLEQILDGLARDGLERILDQVRAAHAHHEVGRCRLRARVHYRWRRLSSTRGAAHAASRAQRVARARAATRRTATEQVARPYAARDRALLWQFDLCPTQRTAEQSVTRATAWTPVESGLAERRCRPHVKPPLPGGGRERVGRSDGATLGRPCARMRLG